MAQDVESSAPRYFAKLALSLSFFGFIIVRMLVMILVLIMILLVIIVRTIRIIVSDTGLRFGPGI